LHPTRLCGQIISGQMYNRLVKNCLLFRDWLTIRELLYWLQISYGNRKAGKRCANHILFYDSFIWQETIRDASRFSLR